MKIQEQGSLIGALVKCPRCKCVSQVEGNDELKISSFPFSFERFYSVECPACKQNFSVVKEEWLPPPPGSVGIYDSKTESVFTELNRSKKIEGWIEPVKGRTGCESGGVCDTTKGPCSCGATH